MEKELKQPDGGVVEVLVVEDSRTQAEQLRYLLEQNGYAVRVAGNGREGLAAVRERRPTLVVSDIVMPEMDGFAMCRAIKSDPDLKDLPVVIVTSLSGVQDIARSLECGADNFIRKPYDPDMLLARLHYIRLNQDLRRGKKLRVGTEVYLEGKTHLITSERAPIIDLLISTYEEAVHMNEELQERQKDIARSNQVLAGLYRIADELNRVSTEAEVCERTLQAVLELPRFEAGWIFLAEGASGCRLAAASQLPAALELPAADGDCRCWRAFLSGEHGRRGTFIVDCDRLQGIVAHGQHATVPLCVNHRCLGVINLIAAAGASFDQDDLKMLDALGDQVAAALERAWLHQHLEDLVAERTAELQQEVIERTRAEERVARLNRIHGVLSGINTTIVRVVERGELFQEACRIAVEHGGFGLAWIGLMEHDSFQLKPMASQAAAGWPIAEYDASLGATLRQPLGGILTEVLSKGRTAICRDLAICSGVPVAAEAVARGYRSMIALPLSEGGNPVGVLALYAAEPDVFDEEELRLLEELAGDISFALDYLAKEARISYLAYYDALTGLPNRALVMDRLNQAVGYAQRRQRAMAVICLDLDRFQVINDGLGHHIGDRVLREVAERLAHWLRDGDTVGRLGADEFALICGDLAGEEDVAPLIGQVQAVLTPPIVVDGNVVRLTASLGISVYPGDTDDSAALLRYAGLAVSLAKDRGRNNAQRFAPELDLRAAERLQVENRLAEALGRDELLLHYQPQFDAQSGTIAGMESLIRWRHPELGLVPPGQFIPIAEESGLIVRIGEWALREACRQNKTWLDAGLSDFPISVNLSMAQFRENSLLATIISILEETGLDPRYLELEVTESLVMSNAEMFISFLRQLKALGVQVAIDDFGTGYSSLTYLKRLPVDRLKVDYTFVRDITSDPGSASICRSVIAIAHNLRLGVVAEGVETEAQAAYLARHSCNSLQGFLLCRPAPADEITAFLRDYAPVARPLSGSPPAATS